jgi:NADH-quinone oxidoreductase subunit N
MTQLDFSTILPYTILTAWACVLLLVDLFIPKDRKGITALLAALGLAITLGFTIAQIGKEQVGFNNMVVLDGFSTFVNALILISGILHPVALQRHRHDAHGASHRPHHGLPRA